jgi:hypothetical protein
MILMVRRNNISISKFCPKFIVASLLVYFVIFLGVGSRDKNGDAAAMQLKHCSFRRAAKKITK